MLCRLLVVYVYYMPEIWGVTSVRPKVESELMSRTVLVVEALYFDESAITKERRDCPSHCSLCASISGS